MKQAELRNAIEQKIKDYNETTDQKKQLDTNIRALLGKAIGQIPSASEVSEAQLNALFNICIQLGPKTLNLDKTNLWNILSTANADQLTTLADETEKQKINNILKAIPTDEAEQTIEAEPPAKDDPFSNIFGDDSLFNADSFDSTILPPSRLDDLPSRLHNLIWKTFDDDNTRTSVEEKVLAIIDNPTTDQEMYSQLTDESDDTVKECIRKLSEEPKVSEEEPKGLDIHEQKDTIEKDGKTPHINSQPINPDGGGGNDPISQEQQLARLKTLTDDTIKNPTLATDVYKKITDIIADPKANPELYSQLTDKSDDNVKECILNLSKPTTGTNSPSSIPTDGKKEIPLNNTQEVEAKPIQAADNVVAEKDISNIHEIDRTPVYNLIDTYAIRADQADEAKLLANQVFDDPELDPKSYKALTSGPSPLMIACVKGLLNQANKTLGYKDTSPKDPTKDMMTFSSGIQTQTKDGSTVKSALTMPAGFGLKKNAVVWNTPVITDFGFPFLNFSSDAMVSILKAPDDDAIKNTNLKKLFKEASKKYGGIWKAIYSAPLELLKGIATDIGDKCTPNYLKVEGNDLIESDTGENIAVIPVKYYSIEPEYEPVVTIPRDFLTTFYDVIDYSSSSKKTYLKYADGLTADEFAEETDYNNGIPPFYILVPKAGKFSKCQIRSGSLFGSLMNLISGRKPCTLVKTIFMGKRGCIAMESDIANKLYSDI